MYWSHQQPKGTVHSISYKNTSKIFALFLYNPSGWVLVEVFCLFVCLFWLSPELGFCFAAVFLILRSNSLLSPAPEALPSLHHCCRLFKHCSHFRFPLSSFVPDKINCKIYQVAVNFTFTENISLLLKKSHPSKSQVGCRTQ